MDEASLDASAVVDLVQGAPISAIHRAVDMGVIHFLDLDEATVSLHIQCPFRVVGAVSGA